MKNRQLRDDFSHFRQCLASQIEKNPYDNSVGDPFAFDLGAYDRLLARLSWPFDCERITAGYTDNPADSPER